MSNSVVSGYSSRVGRHHQMKYNIAPELLASPYLSRPIGSFSRDEGHDKKKRSGSPRDEPRRAKSPRRRREEQRKNNGSDTESIATRSSITSYRTRETYHHHSISHNNARRMVSMKNFLLPREVDKILRGFRQKHRNHPVLKNAETRLQSEHFKQDDDSTIASDCAQSLDDEAVYTSCIQNENVKSTLFSGQLFAEIALRNSGREIGDEGPTIALPPVVNSSQHDKCEEISDLESQHSSGSKLTIENFHAKSGSSRHRKKR